MASANYHILFFWGFVTAGFSAVGVQWGVYVLLRLLCSRFQRDVSPRANYFAHQYLLWSLGLACAGAALLACAFERLGVVAAALLIMLVLRATLLASLAMHVSAASSIGAASPSSPSLSRSGSPDVTDSEEDSLLPDATAAAAGGDETKYRVSARPNHAAGAGKQVHRLLHRARRAYTAVHRFERQHVQASVAGAVAVVAVSLVSVWLAADLCICLQPFQTSTAFTRAHQPLPCVGPSPCHVYLTVPEDMRNGMIVNFHMADTANVPVGWTGKVYYDRTPGEALTDFAFVTEAKRVVDKDDVLGYEAPRVVWYAVLSGLASNATYYFRAGLGGDLADRNEPGFSAPRKFRTAPRTGAVHFVAGGDIGMQSRAPSQLRLAAAQNPLFAAVGGDIAYANAFRACYRRWDAFFDMWDANMRTPSGHLVPMLFSIGNHEVGGFNQPSELNPFFLTYFPWHSQASPDPLLRLSYHHHRVADDVVFLALDSGHLAEHGGRQADWLDDRLSEAVGDGARVRFTTYHVPLYPSVRSERAAGSALGRQHWQPLFDKFHVQIAFENHDHYYKRTFPIAADAKVAASDGTVYLGDGAFAVDVRRIRKPERWYFQTVEETNYIAVVTVNADSSVDVSCLDETSAVFDAFQVPAIAS